LRTLCIVLSENRYSVPHVPIFLKLIVNKIHFHLPVLNMSGEIKNMSIGFPISVSFRDELARKRPKSANFRNFKVFIFHPILMQFLWNVHLDGLFYFEKGSKWGPISEGTWNFFFIQFWWLLSLNWLRQELQVVCRHISSISYSFGDKLNRKGPTKAESQNLNFLILHPILMHFFCKMIIFMGYWWTIAKFCFFISIRGLKFTYLEGIFNTWNSKTRQMSKIQHITVSTLAFNIPIHFPLLTCCGCMMLCLCSPFFIFYLLYLVNV